MNDEDSTALLVSLRLATFDAFDSICLVSCLFWSKDCRLYNPDGVNEA